MNVCSVLYASTCSYLGKEPRKQVFIPLTELVSFILENFSQCLQGDVRSA